MMNDRLKNFMLRTPTEGQHADLLRVGADEKGKPAHTINKGTVVPGS